MAQKTTKVYLRLTSSQNDRLERVCRSYDIESISELVRASLDNFTGGNLCLMPPDRQIRRLRARLAVLNAETDLLCPKVHAAAAAGVLAGQRRSGGPCDDRSV